MDRKKVEEFNCKLLVIFFMVLTIFTTLLVIKSKAVSPDIVSKKQRDMGNPTYITDEEWKEYYDLLCCEWGAYIPDSSVGEMSGSSSAGPFDYDMSKWQDTGYGQGSKIEEHTVYEDVSSDFSPSSFTITTLGYYSIIENHVCTPKEAYIIAEMKMELGGSNNETSSEIIYENGVAKKYTGSLTNALSTTLSTGETVYAVNQKYVLDTGDGAYYVTKAKDKNGNEYYVYETNSDGSLVSYNGNYTIKDPKTGSESQCYSVYQDNVYYQHGGELSNGDKVAANSGNLYLVDYDIVVKENDQYYHASVSNGHTYIQIAWWSTGAGGKGKTAAPNALAKEAEAFEDYILKITKSSSVSSLSYANQTYNVDGETGTVPAPVINYKPDFNKDADQNKNINEADEITVSFDDLAQTYVIGPFSIDYVKESAHIEGREKVVFSEITNVELTSNLGKLELGKDWKFKFLADQARSEDYQYPNPNEVFYIEVDYKENLTSLNKFEFYFKYMNAGAEVDIYGGTYNVVTWEEQEGNEETETETTTTVDADGNEQEESHEVFVSKDVWLECTSVVPHPSQTLGHGIIGARWYEEEKCKWEINLHKGNIEINKVTYDEDGKDVIPVDDTYYFKVYVDGKEFDELKIQTKNGSGSATSKTVYWGSKNGETPASPKFEVVEIGDTKNNGPWTGNIADGKTITVDAKNYIEPEKGTLEIDKKLKSHTPALETEKFHFKVKVTGKFSYDGGKVEEHTSKNPLEIPVEIVGEGKWNSKEFKWYGDAPKYTVEEEIPDGAHYELLNGVINNGNGYLKNSDKPTVATATNKSTTDSTVIEVDKRMISETKPEKGEVFTFDITIKGKFAYGNGNDNIIEQELTMEKIPLNEGNKWHWTSEEITWNEDEVPTYTIKEVDMAEGTKFVSITDEVITSLVNEKFQSKLNPEKTNVIITNDDDNPLIGKLKIVKVSETSDLVGKEFKFHVTVSCNGESKFTYNGTTYDKDNPKIELDVAVTLNEIIENGEKVYKAEWESGVFSWDKDQPAPKYTVEEINLPDDSEFVSITNGQQTIKSSRSISGTLNGVEGDPNDCDNSNPDKAKKPVGLAVVTCINKGKPEPRSAHIAITKKSTNEIIDDYAFFFKVKITGTFKYGDAQHTNETLVLDGSIDGVKAYCGGEDWVSELITWEKDSPAPTYSIEEISIPANIEFVSIGNRDKTSTANKIEGTLVDGAEYNWIMAENAPTDKFVDGSIRIVKKASDDLSGKIFKFNLKVTGKKFEYAGKQYGTDTEEETYTLEGIEVEANGNPWVSGIFSWNKDDPAPQYTVQEVDLPDDVEFVSISNEKFVKTDSGYSGLLEDGCSSDIDRGVQGYLDLTKPIKIVAINKGPDEPNGSHIEITKEVLDGTLKGTVFYFDVTVTSDRPFKYYDLEDPTKVTEYKPDGTPGSKATLKFEHVSVVADEKDWVSGYIEWEDGAEPPQYTVSEISRAFPENVYAVSLRNDVEINNAVGEGEDPSSPDNPYQNGKNAETGNFQNLTIEGKLVGDMTHIIAVNDKDGKTPVKGNILIEKKALSPIIKGEEFTFSLNITGKFTYQGKEYRNLDIKDIKITADGPVWKLDKDEEDDEAGVTDYIYWYEEDGAPTYTVTEETATFADGTEFVSIRNAYQTNTQPAITGTVEVGDNWVLAENTFTDVPYKGRIQIHKVLLDGKGNEIDGVSFKFEVTVDFCDKDGNVTSETKEVTIDSGGYWRSDWYTWSKRDMVPKYHIKEIDNKGYEATINKPDGELIAQDTETGVSGIVSVEAQNKYNEEHKGKIRVNKHLVIDDKLKESDVTVSFSFLVNITGDFTYKNKAYNNDTLTLKVTVSKDNNWTWTSDNIKWNGDKAPVYIVEEIESEIPQGWHFVSTKSSEKDNELKDGGTVVVDITNEWTYDEEIILTMRLGGKVWDDTNRTIDKHVDALENGVIDDGEAGIPNVKVTVYRALVSRATGKVQGRLDGVYAYDENNLSVRIDNVTYTDENGNWSFGAVSVPAFVGSEKNQYGDGYCVTYDVEFEYDGQTYEPTEFLATAGGKANSYVGADSSNNMYSYVENRWSTIINSSTSERDKYLLDSMAIDNLNERTAFNNSFADVQGKTPIDGNGNTEGTTGGQRELNYTSIDSMSFFNSDNSRKISTLRTLDDEGNIYNDLLISSATSNSNLTFPFYTEDPQYDRTAWHLKSWDKTITDEFKITYKFEAIYNYCLSINLGLVEREATDVAVEKDLSEALVVVNGKALKYKFNTAIDLEDPDYEELLYKQLAVADAQIEYKIGLYKGDYYYRAEVYNENSEIKNALEGFYTGTVNLPLETTEMEIYLKYTINVYNQSETYDVTIGEIADYYDSTFKLMKEKEERYIQDLNGTEVNGKMEVANVSTVSYPDETKENVDWKKDKNYEGSDGVKYTKIVTNSLANKKLATGEKASITVTFKIDKDDVGESGVHDTIKLGKKHNVAEVTKFTSYYSKKSENRWSQPGQISGRVDEDSAPDNVNIGLYNEKAYYEDDTDSAPIITIGFDDGNDRAVSGLAWDDAQTQSVGLGQVVGNGLYNPDEGDKPISGLTTQIYQSILIPDPDGGIDSSDHDNIVYKEYQFAWPTDKDFDVLGGKSMEKLTGFKQSTVTDTYGQYEFINVPAGNYKVRYVYGDKKIETGKDGSEEFYSGQDYKSTAYQIGFNNDSNDDGYVDNQWHDITNSKLADLRVNDARDDEARRLFISAKSEMLTYTNTSKLAEADDKDSIDDLNEDEREGLFGDYWKIGTVGGETKLVANKDTQNNPVTGKGYYMYSETAKINLGVENIYKIGYTTETITTSDDDKVDVGIINGKATQNGMDVGTEDFTYNIKNVDCGIEERSPSKLTLDKQVKQITLTSSDYKVILDAIYDIDYTLKKDGSIESSVTLNKEASTGIDHIASLDRSKNNQGYRYIIADGQILQGARIEIKYQFKIFNMSETDRISKSLEELWEKFDATNCIDHLTADMLKNETNLKDLKNAMSKVSTPLYTETKGRVIKEEDKFVGVGYGTYFGSVYYLGSQGVGVRPDETIVKTKVHQMLDYVDPDIEFSNVNNNTENQSWINTDIDYLTTNALLEPTTIQVLDNEGKITGDTKKNRPSLSGEERYSIINDNLQEYISGEKNNLIVNMDDSSKAEVSDSEDKVVNPNSNFVKFLEPYMANNREDRATGAITLSVGRFYTSELDANDVDNLAEIIKFENTAGRRDARNIAGNINPYKVDTATEEPISVYEIATQGKEKDASATELVTLSPPTGLSAEESRTMQLILVILISTVLIGVSIVVIKKKVLPKNK